MLRDELWPTVSVRVEVEVMVLCKRVKITTHCPYFFNSGGKKIPKVYFIGEEIEETVGRAKQEKSISRIHKGDKENYDETMTILKLFLCSPGFVHGYVIMFKPEKVSSKPCPQSWK